MTSKNKTQRCDGGVPHSFTVTFQTSDEADRMKDTNSTPQGHWTNALAMLGLLVCVAGCAGPLTNQSWFNQSAPTVPASGSANGSFTVSPITGETLTPPTDPGEVNFSLSDINLGDNTAANVTCNWEQQLQPACNLRPSDCSRIGLRGRFSNDPKHERGSVTTS